MPHQRPQSNEYSPHHERYLSLVSAPVLGTLRDQRNIFAELPRVIAESDAGYRYENGKWSIREVVGHISDAERIFQFRALAFARGDTAPLSQYDPDGYVERSGFDHRTLRSIVDELLAVRESTLSFFENLDAAAWNRKGTVSGGFVSVRALGFIAAGHAQQHLNVLYERYGVGDPSSAAVSVA
jgi:hypothetical protein